MILERALILILFIAMSPVNSFGAITEAQCSTKDFKNSFSPPRDQGSMGYCYAFAASDLLGEATGTKVTSAFYAAVRSIDFQAPEDNEASCEVITENRDEASYCKNKDFADDRSVFLQTYHAERPLLTRQGGVTEFTMATLIHQGYTCTEAQVPSQKGRQQYVGDTEHSFVEMESDFLVRRINDLSQYHKVENIKANSELMDELNKSCLKDAPLKGFQQLLSTKADLEQWALNKLRSNHEHMCKNKVNIKGLKVHRFEKEDPSSFSKKMMDVLDMDRPFAITYNIASLLGDAEAMASHASTVTGRQWNKKTKTCQIEIKNSWGLECPQAKDPSICNHGYLLVDIDKLSSIASDISWIPKKKKE